MIIGRDDNNEMSKNKLTRIGERSNTTSNNNNHEIDYEVDEYEQFHYIRDYRWSNNFTA